MKISSNTARAMNFLVVCAATLAFASVTDADIIISKLVLLIYNVHWYQLIFVTESSPVINNTEVKDIYIQILRGRDGCDGLTGRDGQKGERGDIGMKGDGAPMGPAGPKSGGVVYTRWGKTSYVQLRLELNYYMKE